jgi:hypothetical protein
VATENAPLYTFSAIAQALSGRFALFAAFVLSDCPSALGPCCKGSAIHGHADHLPRSMGFCAFDASHIACADSAGAEVFLTTDDSLWLRALHEASKLSIHAESPAKRYAEVIVL